MRIRPLRFHASSVRACAAKSWYTPSAGRLWYAASLGVVCNAGELGLRREVFALARRRLADDGLISLYIPLNSTPFEYEMVVRTFPVSRPGGGRRRGQTCSRLGA